MDTIATATAPHEGRTSRPRATDAAAALVVAAALAGAYAPNLADLARTWNNDASYSHGFLVIPIALGILWHRRDRLDRARVRPSAWGWAALAALLAARALLYHRNELWAESATLPVAAAALVLAFGGWHALRWAASALAFLAFMLPLPASVNSFLASPLQTLATLGSTSLLQALGLPALAEGHIIYVGAHQLEVERACNGLAMLLTFVALIVATTIVVDRPLVEKGVLLASAVPIALVSNILRIVLTALAYHQFGPDAIVIPDWAVAGWKLGPWTVGQASHDTAGWAMMPIGLALVWIELRLMSWLVVEDDGRPIAPVITRPAKSPR